MQRYLIFMVELQYTLWIAGGKITSPVKAQGKKKHLVVRGVRIFPLAWNHSETSKMQINPVFALNIFKTSLCP